MTAIILDGKKIRDEAVPLLSKRVSSFSFVPSLVIIQVGTRADSTSFIKSKKDFATKIGINVRHIQLPEDIKQEKIIEVIRENNEDSSVHGIIVQLPLPINLDRDAIIDNILPGKDVDALTAYNVKRWLDGSGGAIFPATSRGILKLLQKNNINLLGKKVVVVGRSTLVGKPIVSMCLNENATVTICHSKTPNLAEETKRADILIVATGKMGLIKAEHVKVGQVIIDVGINNIVGDNFSNKKLSGDIDFESVIDIVSAITPVPGGVGPLTVLSLFENMLDLIQKTIK